MSSYEEFQHNAILRAIRSVHQLCCTIAVAVIVLWVVFCTHVALLHLEDMPTLTAEVTQP